MPADAFMAQGIYGQTVVVVPSQRLVIARFGTTYDLRMAMIDICRLTTDTIAALVGAIAGACTGVSAFPAEAVRVVRERNGLDLDQLARQLLELRTT